MKERDNIMKREILAEKQVAFKALNRELQDTINAKSDAIRR